jgi:hypothetical protein
MCRIVSQLSNLSLRAQPTPARDRAHWLPQKISYTRLKEASAVTEAHPSATPKTTPARTSLREVHAQENRAIFEIPEILAQLLGASHEASRPVMPAPVAADAV